MNLQKHDSIQGRTARAHQKENSWQQRISSGSRRSSVLPLARSKPSMSEAKINVFLYVKMSTVMGFVWAIGFAAAVAETPVLWYIFEIFLPLQGVFILIAFICKRRIFRLYKKLLCGKKRSGQFACWPLKTGLFTCFFFVSKAADHIA